MSSRRTSALRRPSSSAGSRCGPWRSSGKVAAACS
ncbi:hypothetical protein HU200_014004 [Digitaria exilis]|uniref:Uncharacterized protein n=1 Tax=Digitaria exilis TaxID=1010633 RepID=A0A835KJ63_9POAL|nr:hypothetical protein HU200_046860 [Digitaria exilis]KAF8737927.1 hypothetical protein HU200_014004 [Digitaria exilis]